MIFAICARFIEPFADLASSVTTEKSPTAPQPPRPTPFHVGRFHRTYLPFEHCYFFPTSPCFSSFCLKLTLSKTYGVFQSPAHCCQQISGQLRVYPLSNVSASVRHGGPFAHPHHGLICNLFIVYVCSSVLEGIITNFVLGTNRVASHGTLSRRVVSYHVALYPAASRHVMLPLTYSPSPSQPSYLLLPQSIRPGSRFCPDDYLLGIQPPTIWTMATDKRSRS